MKRITVIISLLVFVVSAWAQLDITPQDKTPPHDRENFRELLQRLADFSPDPCGPPYGQEKNWHSADVESPLFEQAAELVTQELNTTPATPVSPRDRAFGALEKLEAMSAEINVAWPEEHRFHFEVIDLPPALVVKITIRVHGRFFVFGIPQENSGKPNRLWRRVGSDDESLEHEVPQSSLDLYPLHRGASGNARFLAKFIHSGCAGSIGVAYDAREWNPQGIGGLERIIEQHGAFGLDDKVADFPQVGKLETKGPLVTLPYCWFSSVDTWDNPSLCAVDTYDLSGDDVRFRSRAYNRSDLVPIAKAIEYSEQHDHPAVLGYCTSPQVANTLVRNIPPHVSAEDLRVTHIGKEKERVELGGYRFDVEERAGRWLIVAFRPE